MEGKHDIYLLYLSEEEIATSEKWIDQLQEYNGASAVYMKYENEKQLMNRKKKKNWTPSIWWNFEKKSFKG